MKFTMIFFLFIASATASEESEVIATLWQELGHPPISNIKKKVSQNNYLNTPKEIKTKRVLSPGEKKIEEIKARNRKILKQRKIETHTSKSNFYNPSKEGLSRFKKVINDSQERQKNQLKATRLKWKKSRNKFLNKLSTYKKNTFEIQSSTKISNKKSMKLLPKNFNLVKGRDYFVIKNAFDIGVKDQGKRPTCSAFAGSSAIEILLRQSKSNLKVSEQYLYWSSKPYCQTAPCSKKGSWITLAYDKSIASSSYDIPSDQNCPYITDPKPGNETQIPLRRGCLAGKVKIRKYNKLQSSSELYKSLNNNSPVIVGVKLTPNFYKSNGIITYQESLVNGKMDNHANGHALLLIGHMKLPKSLNSEGRICYLAVNSWTKGWGAGGYGCITEKWLTKYKVNNPFVALTQVRSL